MDNRDTWKESQLHWMQKCFVNIFCKKGELIASLSEKSAKGINTTPLCKIHLCAEGSMLHF